jgi:hypothetical protein
LSLTERIRIVCMAVLLACSTVHNAKAASATDVDRRYAAMVEQSRSMPKDFDFAVARALYTQTSAYHPQSLFPTRDFLLLIDRAQKGDASVAKDAEAYTTVNFAVPEAQTRAMAVDRILHNNMARYHEWAARGLMAAMLHSGDGRSAATAYKVVVVSEEYLIMHQVMNRTGQRTEKREGHFYDVQSGLSKADGKPVDVWFDVTPLFAAAAH